MSVSNAAHKPRDRAEGIESVDFYLASRLVAARKMRGLTREGLAALVGDVQAKQIEKWEQAKNRMFANRLWAVSRKLQLPVAWFFEGFMPSPHTGPMTHEQAARLLTPENTHLLEAYESLPETEQRLVRQMIASLRTAAANDEAGYASVGGEARA